MWDNQARMRDKDLHMQDRPAGRLATMGTARRQFNKTEEIE